MNTGWYTSDPSVFTIGIYAFFPPTWNQGVEKIRVECQ